MSTTIKYFRNKKLFLLFCSIPILIGLVLFFYNIMLKQNLQQSSFVALDELIVQQKNGFSSEMRGEMSTIESLGLSLGHIDTMDARKHLLEDALPKTRFEYIVMVDKAGKGQLADGDAIDISDEPFFHAALGGATVLAETTLSETQNMPIVPILAPIYENGQISSVLLATYDASKLNDLLQTSYSGESHVYVTTADGDILAQTKNSDTAIVNLLSILQKEATYSADKSFDSMLNDVYLGNVGNTSYDFRGEKMLMSYSPLGLNDWYVFVSVPYSVIAADAVKITSLAALLAVFIILCFTAFIFYLLVIKTKAESQQKAHIQELESILYYDQLTTAPTYSKFKTDAQKILEENPHDAFVIVKIDVEGFKLINEIFGFDLGDQVLIALSTVSQIAATSPRECYAKIGVDEFVLLLEFTTLEELAQRRESFIRHFYSLLDENFTYHIDFPTGQFIVEPGKEKPDIHKLFERVNFAHRRAKSMPQASFICTYDEALTKEARNQKEIENKMLDALENKEFLLYLQPKFHLVSGSMAGAESLCRWMCDGVLVPPSEFIPILERTGYIAQLDFYMFDQSCLVLKRWMTETDIPPVPISVNFSRLHLNNPHFVEKLSEIADHHQVPRHLLEIELTESIFFEREDLILKVFHQLHDAGFILSMDDFGSGYSSLGLLKDIPVDVIKMDKAFFATSANNSRTEIVVHCVLQMARHLGVTTVAEGVETQSNIDLLSSLGCDIVQGYYYARPIPACDFSKEYFGLDPL